MTFCRPVMVLLMAGAALALQLPSLPASAQENPALARRGDRIHEYDPEIPLGTHRVRDDQGREYIIYSTTGPSEQDKAIRESNRRDRENQWALPCPIIIDTRGYHDR